MIERKTAEEAIEDAIRAMQRDVWTVLPGRVVSVTASKSTATVQPFPADYLDGEIVALPEIPDVPICWPGGGGALITWPLSPGDKVLLLMAARPIARYRETGSEADPQSVRTHDLSDAMCIPLGLVPDADAEVMDADDLVIRRPTGGKVVLGQRIVGVAAVARDGDTVDMTAGGAGSWVTWATGVNAQLVAAGGASVPLPVSAPEVVATSTTVEAT